MCVHPVHPVGDLGEQLGHAFVDGAPHALHEVLLRLSFELLEKRHHLGVGLARFTSVGRIVGNGHGLIILDRLRVRAGARLLHTLGWHGATHRIRTRTQKRHIRNVPKTVPCADETYYRRRRAVVIDARNPCMPNALAETKTLRTDGQKVRPIPQNRHAVHTKPADAADRRAPQALNPLNPRVELLN